MPRVFHEATMSDLHKAVGKQLLTAKAADLDFYSSVDTQLHNVVAEADSMEWDFDLKDLWLTSARWTTMVRQYLDPEQVQIMMKNVAEKIGRKHRGIAAMRTKAVPAKLQNNGKVTRRWGSCMLAISYKAIPQPQITLYSRTSYIGYLGAMDMSVAWMIGRYIAEMLDLEMEDMRFVWYNEMAQFHGFKSLAFIFNYFPQLVPLVEKRELPETKLAEVMSRPGLKLARNWLQRTRRQYEDEGRMYGIEKYNTYLRIVRRYHTEVRGYEYAQQFASPAINRTERGTIKKAYAPLPSLPIENLDLRKIGLPALTDFDPDQYEVIDDDDDDTEE